MNQQHSKMYLFQVHFTVNVLYIMMYMSQLCQSKQLILLQILREPQEILTLPSIQEALRRVVFAFILITASRAPGCSCSLNLPTDICPARLLFLFSFLSLDDCGPTHFSLWLWWSSAHIHLWNGVAAQTLPFFYLVFNVMSAVLERSILHQDHVCSFHHRSWTDHCKSVNSPCGSIVWMSCLSPSNPHSPIYLLDWTCVDSLELKKNPIFTL